MITYPLRGFRGLLGEKNHLLNSHLPQFEFLHFLAGCPGKVLHHGHLIRDLVFDGFVLHELIDLFPVQKFTGRLGNDQSRGKRIDRCLEFPIGIFLILVNDGWIIGVPSIGLLEHLPKCATLSLLDSMHLTVAIGQFPFSHGMKGILLWYFINKILCRML